MPEQTQTAVCRNYGFALERDGVRAGFFLKLTGLGVGTDVIEYREGGSVGNVRKLPGRTKVYDITLEHGVANSASLWQWLQSSMQGRPERCDVCIILLAANGHDEAARWNLTDCWLSDSRVCDFDARGNDVLIEKMTLVAESVEFEPGAGAA